MKSLSGFLIFLFTLNVIAEENINTNVVNKPDHTIWNNLLQKHVDALGNVNYKAFKTDNGKLETYLNNLAENYPTDAWTKEEKLAYYINLYNAATVKLIADNYPLKSIKDLKNPWNKEWVKVGNRNYSLGDIEHKILRKMNDPRIHFAINCASYSCPKLANMAYLPLTLETQLAKATSDFINDPSKNTITKNTLSLSNIFKWYKGDFTEKGNLIDFIKRYAKKTIDANSKINYLEYNWSLNEIK